MSDDLEMMLLKRFMQETSDFMKNTRKWLHSEYPELLGKYEELTLDEENGLWDF